MGCGASQHDIARSGHYSSSSPSRGRSTSLHSTSAVNNNSTSAVLNNDLASTHSTTHSEAAPVPTAATPAGSSSAGTPNNNNNNDMLLTTAAVPAITPPPTNHIIAREWSGHSDDVFSDDDCFGGSTGDQAQSYSMKQPKSFVPKTMQIGDLKGISNKLDDLAALRKIFPMLPPPAVGAGAHLNFALERSRSGEVGVSSTTTVGSGGANTGNGGANAADNSNITNTNAPPPGWLRLPTSAANDVNGNATVNNGATTTVSGGGASGNASPINNNNNNADSSTPLASAAVSLVIQQHNDNNSSAASSVCSNSARSAKSVSAKEQQRLQSTPDLAMDDAQPIAPITVLRSN